MTVEVSQTIDSTCRASTVDVHALQDQRTRKHIRCGRQGKVMSRGIDRRSSADAHLARVRHVSTCGGH